ncbi:hypothetical protein SCAR479_00106 [Seiridium cardinale]|uniref:Uncharacterized protein n=1 Tax=Seiridium cardinale TaxID=138064 RepID=A0ABR2Y995_9PEZI
MGMFRTLVAVTWAAMACVASPVPMEVAVLGDANTDFLVKKGIELAQSRGLERRLSADFSMEKTWDNEVLFGGSWSDTQEDGAEKTALSITCLECYTKGTVTARLWEDLFHPTVRLEFNQVEAYVFLGVETSASGTYSINLFASQSPIGLGFPGLSVGVVFYVDLVFSLSAEIDLTGGFYVKLADDAYLETDIFGGDITDSFFDGISSKSIPVTVQSGFAEFKADLRLRVQCGAETSLPLIGIGSGAVVGIYANIIEFVAVIDSTPDCALETKEWWDLNAGAYAHLDVVVDFTTIGPVPTVSTTLLTAPTMTQCWVEAGSSSISTSTTSASTIISATTRSSSVPYSTGSGVLTQSSSSYQESSSSATLTLTSQASSVTSTPVYNSTSTLINISSSKYPISNVSVTSVSNSSDGGALVTSTIYSTTEYTLTSCAASVVNCPVSYQKEVTVTQTIDAFTTVCPASAQITASPSSSLTATTGRATTPTAVYILTEQVVLLTPCATPVTNTFTPPSSAATVEIAAVATHKTAASAAIASYSQATGGWSNSTAVAKPSASTIHSQQAGSLKSVTTQTPLTAGAGTPVRPLSLAVIGFLGFFLVLV